MSHPRKKTPAEILPDYTRNETMLVLNVGPSKLDQLIQQGVLKSYKLGPDPRSGRRIIRESVEDLRNSWQQAGKAVTA